MSDISSRVYWKTLRLGDFKVDREDLTLEASAPEFKPSTGAALAHTQQVGPSAYWRCAVDVGMGRNIQGTEGSAAFWSRVRQFAVDWRAELYTNNDRFGWLAFVRDPAGLQFGAKDSTEIDTADVIAGSGVTINKADSANWTAGQKVLIIDSAQPDTASEIVTITTGGTSSFVADIAYNHATTSELHRLEWYLPTCCPIQPLSVPVDGPSAKNFVQRIPLVFAGIADPVNGGLA